MTRVSIGQVFARQKTSEYAILHLMPNVSDRELLAELGQKYIWWSPIGDEPHTPERIIAQVMNIGTYDDIRRLETALGFARLADVMAHAAPGWFSVRSWSFWRGRLQLETDIPIPTEPPRRSFHAADV